MRQTSIQYGPYVFRLPNGAEVISPDLVVSLRQRSGRMLVRVGLHLDREGAAQVRDSHVFGGAAIPASDCSLFLELLSEVSERLTTVVDGNPDPARAVYDVRRPNWPVWDFRAYSLRGVEEWVAKAKPAEDLPAIRTGQATVIVLAEPPVDRAMLHLLAGDQDRQVHICAESAAVLTRADGARVPVILIHPAVGEAETLAGTLREQSPHATIMMIEPSELVGGLAAAGLADRVQRAVTLGQVLADEDVAVAMAEMGALPVMPATYAAVCRAMAQPNAAITEVAAIVERDVGLVGQVLALVNSAYFGLPKRVGNISQAVGLLGLRRIRDLLLMLEVFEALPPKVAGLSIERMQSRCLAVAEAASQIIGDTRRAPDAYTAGILHDIGRMMLAARLPGPFARALNLEGDLVAAERQVLGITHHQVAGYVLGRWEIPRPVVEAVLLRETPQRGSSRVFDLVGALHVASALVDKWMDEPSPTRLDLNYLRSLGLDDRVGAWSTQVRAIVDGTG